MNDVIYSLLHFCRVFSHNPIHWNNVSVSGFSPATLLTLIHRSNDGDDDDDDDFITFTVSNG